MLWTKLIATDCSTSHMHWFSLGGSADWYFIDCMDWRLAVGLPKLLDTMLRRMHTCNVLERSASGGKVYYTDFCIMLLCILDTINLSIGWVMVIHVGWCGI
jgi:hypothetical protein